MDIKEKALQLAFALKFQGIERDLYELMIVILSYEKLQDPVLPFNIESAIEIGKQVYEIKKRDAENNSLNEA